MKIEKLPYNVFKVTLASGESVTAYPDNDSKPFKAIHALCTELDKLNSLAQEVKCPQCNEGVLIEFSSLDQKECSHCSYTEEWKRKPGQPSKY